METQAIEHKPPLRWPGTQETQATEKRRQDCGHDGETEVTDNLQPIRWTSREHLCSDPILHTRRHHFNTPPSSPTDGSRGGRGRWSAWRVPSSLNGQRDQAWPGHCGRRSQKGQPGSQKGLARDSRGRQRGQVSLPSRQTACPCPCPRGVVSTWLNIIPSFLPSPNTPPSCPRTLLRPGRRCTWLPPLAGWTF